MSAAELFGNGAGNVSGMATKAAAALGGIGLMIKMHETIDQDAQGIVLSRGKVKLDRSTVKEEFGVSNMRRGRRILAAYAVAHGFRELDVIADHAAIFEPGGHFAFFNLRSFRKVETNDQTSALPSQRIMLKAGLCVLDHSVTWGVEPTGKNAARAILRAKNMEELGQKVVASTAAAARESVLELDAAKDDAVTSLEVFKGIKVLCAPSLYDTYGVVLKSYDLLTLDPSEAETGRTIRFEGPDKRIIPPEELGLPALRVVSSTQTGA